MSDTTITTTETTTTALELDNPYLYEYQRVTEHNPSWRAWEARERLVNIYAWAIPDDEALAALVALSPLVEIGAGNGYWAWMLRKRGADVLAFDAEPPEHADHSNSYFKRHAAGDTIEPLPHLWTPVAVGGPEQAALHTDRTLLLCWPDYDTSFAYECLRSYLDAGGQTVAYIGEGEGGCTGDTMFHWLLAKAFTERDYVHIPQWSSIHDGLYIYRRDPNVVTVTELPHVEQEVSERTQ